MFAMKLLQIFQRNPELLLPTPVTQTLHAALENTQENQAWSQHQYIGSVFLLLGPKPAAFDTTNRLALAFVPVDQLSGRWWRRGRCLFRTGSGSRCASPDKRSTQSLSGLHTQTSLKQTHTWNHNCVIAQNAGCGHLPKLWLFVSRDLTCLSRLSVRKTAQGSLPAAALPMDLGVVCELC